MCSSDLAKHLVLGLISQIVIDANSADTDEAKIVGFVAHREWYAAKQPSGAGWCVIAVRVVLETERQ